MTARTHMLSILIVFPTVHATWQYAPLICHGCSFPIPGHESEWDEERRVWCEPCAIALDLKRGDGHGVEAR